MRPDDAVSVPRCPNVVVIKDDRWGRIRDRCELPEGHAGDHRSARTACEPLAYLGWGDS